MTLLQSLHRPGMDVSQYSCRFAEHFRINILTCLSNCLSKARRGRDVTRRKAVLEDGTKDVALSTNPLQLYHH